MVSLLTTPKPVDELQGPVYGVTPLPSGQALPLYRRPLFVAGVAGIVFVCMNLYSC